MVASGQKCVLRQVSCVEMYTELGFSGVINVPPSTASSMLKLKLMRMKRRRRKTMNMGVVGLKYFTLLIRLIASRRRIHRGTRW